MSAETLHEIREFLGCPTPEQWLRVAEQHVPELLIDHAQCEKKAASSALQLMFRYPEDEQLANRMSKLAREELRHFEQVLKIMQERNIADRKQAASRYAAGLRQHIRKNEPERLVDTLIVGAFIEARSCERFAALVPLLDDQLAQFYAGLLASEGRHYLNYLQFAKRRWCVEGSKAEFNERVGYFRNAEQELINSPDSQFRFHSGTPA